MRTRYTGLKVVLGLLCAINVMPVTPAHGGPLLDWLFGHHRRDSLPAYPAGPPIPLGSQTAGFAPYAAVGGTWTGYPAVGSAYYAMPYTAGYATGYGSTGTSSSIAPGTAGMSGFGCTGTAIPGGTGADLPAPSLPPPAVGSTPSTTSITPPAGAVVAAPVVPNFRSLAARVPVTYYRPVVTTDPATGAQRVVMAPCTSYEYQTRRMRIFGRRSLFGSLFGPRMSSAPLPQAVPTYTLPSGGIPVATFPMIPLPTTGTVGAYGAYQPVVPAGGTVVGGTGSTTTLMAPVTVPGTTTTAPGACNSTAPGVTVPGTYVPTAPSTGTSLPGTGTTSPPSSVLPPTTVPSTDPAASVPPSLSNVDPRSSSDGARDAAVQRSFTLQRTPIPQPHRAENGDAAARASRPSEGDRTLPVLRPIPLPEGFEPPQRWNPGLLSDDDLTAQRDVSTPAAGTDDFQPIRWASFESTQVAREQDERQAAKAVVNNREVGGQWQSSQRGHVLRPITPPRQQSDQEVRRGDSRLQTPTTQPRVSPSGVYHTGGWKPSRS